MNKQLHEVRLQARWLAADAKAAQLSIPQERIGTFHSISVRFQSIDRTFGDLFHDLSDS
jgi:hypothetical protein